jgi:signal transduction histidine kinase
MESQGQQSTATIIEKGLVNAYLATRLVHLVQGFICVATGWRNYARPRLAAAVLVSTTVESVWLVRRVVRLKTVDPLAARVETATGTAGLLLLAAATPFEARTTSMNWMLPYSVASTLGLAINSNRLEGVLDVSALTTTYLATTMRPRHWSGQAVTALTNAASYGGFHGVAAVVIDRGRRDGSELDRVKAESASRAEKLSVERERNHQHRMMHDSALQTLEAIGNGIVGAPDAVRDRAREEAHRLRRALTGVQPENGFEESLLQLASEFSELGLEVTYSSDHLGDLPADVAQVLTESTREALRNVVKHAQTQSAVVRVVAVDAGVQVTIRDHGVGFDPETTGRGFGLRESVAARVGELGGTVVVWSEPARGTRVTLWAPVR